MKLLVYFLIIPILLVTTQLQGARTSLSTEERLFLSKIDEDFFDGEDDSDEWVTLIKQFGRDKVAVQFPKQPNLKYRVDDQGFETFTFVSSDEEATYSLTIETKKEDDFFAKALADLKNNPEIKLVDSSQNGSVLDLTYLDRTSLYKKRLLATSERVYTFLTTASENGENEHDFFCQSMKIIKPLKGKFKK